MEDDPKKPDGMKRDAGPAAASEEDFSLESLVKKNSKPAGYKADDVGQTALPYQKEFIDNLRRIQEAADGIPPPPPKREKDPLSLRELARASAEGVKLGQETGPAGAGRAVPPPLPPSARRIDAVEKKGEIIGGALEQWFDKYESVSEKTARAFFGAQDKPAPREPVADPLGVLERERVEGPLRDAREFRESLGGPIEKWARGHKTGFRALVATAILAVAGAITGMKTEDPKPERTGVTQQDRIGHTEKIDFVHEVEGPTIVATLEDQINGLTAKTNNDIRKMMTPSVMPDGKPIPGMDLSRKPDPNRVYKITRPDIQPFQGDLSSLKDFNVNAKAESGPKTPLGVRLASLAVPGLEGPDGGAPRNDKVSEHRVLSKAELMKKNPDGSPKASK